MKAFIFDLDGTLLNTLGDIGGACNVMLAGHGYPEHPINAYAKMVGNGFETLVTRALPPDAGLDAAAIGTLTAEAKAIYAEHLADRTEPYAGMPETLARLAAKGSVLAVLSNKPDNLSARLIELYFPDIPFAHVQGARQNLPLKPDPYTLLELINGLNLKKSETCYIGDSDVDVLTAHNAGLTAVGAAWGFRGPAELASAGADCILADPRHLTELLDC